MALLNSEYIKTASRFRPHSKAVWDARAPHAARYIIQRALKQVDPLKPRSLPLWMFSCLGAITVSHFLNPTAPSSEAEHMCPLRNIHDRKCSGSASGYSGSSQTGNRRLVSGVGRARRRTDSPSNLRPKHSNGRFQKEPMQEAVRLDKRRRKGRSEVK